LTGALVLKNLGIVLFTFYLLSSCGQSPIGLRFGYDSDNNVFEENTESQKSSESISFETVNQKIFKTNCTTCHASQRLPILNSYEDYKTHLGQVEKHTLIIKDMPPRGPLSLKDQRLLKQWIDQGAPFEGAPLIEEPLPVQNPKAPVYWSEINEKIFVKNCNSCHYSGNKLGEDGDSLSLFADLEQVRSTMGTIYYATVIAAVMPPIQKDAKEGDLNLNQLSDSEKELLSRWIIQGMKADPIDEQK
jgi:mono/diheme cytochrome c family protein